MATKYTLPYTESARYIDDLVNKFPAMEKLSRQERAAVAGDLLSSRDEVFDFSSYADAGMLLRLRGDTTNAIRGFNKEYTEPAVIKAMGNNWLGRGVAQGVSGLTENLPELAIMAATRRPNAKLLGAFGGLAAGTGAYLNQYADTNDKLSSAVSGLTMGLTPIAINAASKAPVVKDLLASPSRVGQFVGDVAAGELVGAATTPLSVAITPRQQVVLPKVMPNQAVRVPSEEVNLTDFKTMGQRLQEFATPENLTAIAVSDLGMSAISTAQRSAKEQGKIAIQRQQEVKPFAKESTHNVRQQLIEMGFAVPEALTNTELASIQSIIPNNIGANTDYVQYRLLNAVEPTKLNPHEATLLKSLGERIDDSKLLADDINNLYSQEAGNIDGSPFFQNLERAMRESQMPADEYSSKYKEVVDQVSQFASLFGRMSQRVSNNPKAAAAHQSMIRITPQSSMEIMNTMSKWGQNREGSLPETEAFRNTMELIKRVNSGRAEDARFTNAVFEALQEGNKNLIGKYTEEVTGKDGKPVQVEKTYEKTGLDLARGIDVDALGAKHKLNDAEIQFIKGMQNAPVELARIRMSKAKHIMTLENVERLRQLYDSNIAPEAALRPISNYVENAHKILSQIYTNDYYNRQKAKGKNYVSNVESEEAALVRAITDNIQKDFAQGSTPVSEMQARNQGIRAETFARKLVDEAAVNVQAFLRNGRIGYSPMTQRGRYWFSYTNEEGVPQFRASDDLEGLKRYRDQLAKELGPDKVKPVDDFKRSPRSYIEDSEYQTIYQLRQDLLNRTNKQIGSLESIRRQMIEANPSDIQNINNYFDAASKVLQDSDQGIINSLKKSQEALDAGSILQKTNLRRKRQSDVEPQEMFQNLIELMSAGIHSSYAQEAKAHLKMALADPMVRADTEAYSALKAIQEYSNMSPAEWGAARGLLTGYFLALSPRFISQNLTQVPLLAPAYWREYTGRSSTTIPYYLTKAVSHNNGWGWKGTTGNKTMDSLVRRGELDGVFLPEYIHELQGISRPDALRNSTKPGLVKESVYRLSDWMNGLNRASERENRRVAFLMYLTSVNERKALSALSEKDLAQVYNRAMNFSNTINMAGGKYNRPQIVMESAKWPKVHGAALLATSLLNFTIGMAGKAGSALRATIGGYDPVKIVDKSFKVEDKKVMVNMILTFGLAAGAYGVPFSEELEYLVRKLDPDFSWEKVATRLKEFSEEVFDLNPEIAQSLRDGFVHGIPGLFGIDLSSVIGFPSLSPDSLGSPAWSAVKQIRGGFEALAQGDVDKAIRKGSPSFVRQFLGAQDILTEGVIRDSQGNIMTEPGFKPTAGQELAKLVGGGTTEEVSTWRLRKDEAGYRERARQLEEKVVNKLSITDPSSWPKILESVKEELPLNTLSERMGLYEQVANRLTARNVGNLHRDVSYRDAAAYERMYADRNMNLIEANPVGEVISKASVAAKFGDEEAAKKILGGLSRADVIQTMGQMKGIPRAIAGILSKEKLTSDDVTKLLFYLRQNSL